MLEEACYDGQFLLTMQFFYIHIKINLEGFEWSEQNGHDW